MDLLLFVESLPPDPPHSYWQEIKDLSSNVSDTVIGTGPNETTAVCGIPPSPHPDPTLTGRRSKTSAPMLAIQSQALALTGLLLFVCCRIFTRGPSKIDCHSDKACTKKMKINESFSIHVNPNHKVLTEMLKWHQWRRQNINARV